MDPSCLNHILTPAEERQFAARGYIVFDQMLPPAMVAALTAVSDRIDAEERQKRGVGPRDRLTIRDMIWRDGLFLELVDWPRALPKIWGALGWNIQIYHTVLAYSPPGDGPVAFQGWHQDSDRVNHEIESSPRPRISVKIAHFLTDCTEEGRANFWVVPGSHLMDTYEIPDDGALPEGAEPVIVPQGGAVLFDRRIWHTASSNATDVPRKAIFYGYSYRWLRPRDDQTVEHLYERSDPIRRQLLGYSPNGGFGYSSPREEDAPLRAFLREHLGAAVAT